MRRYASTLTGCLVLVSLHGCGSSEERDFAPDGAAGQGGTAGSGGSGAVAGSGGSTGGTGGSAGSGGAGGSAASGGTGGSAGTGGAAGAAGAGGECENLTSCDGSCVDTSSNGSHCGVCGRDCLGADCVGGQCQPESIHAETGMTRFAVDTTHVYYGAPDPTITGRLAVRRVPIGGGTPLDLALDQRSPIVEVLVDATHVYWAGGSNTATSHVRRVPKAGGTVQNLITGTAAPQALGASSSTLFFTASDPLQTPGRSLHRVNKDGGSYLNLASAATAQPLAGVAASASFVYYAEAGTTAALRQRATTNLGTPTSLVPGQTGIEEVVFHSNEVFWTAAGFIRKAGADGSNVVDIGTATGDIEGLAIDATDVYWTEAAGGQRNLITALRAGSGQRTLLTGIGGATLGIGRYQVQTDGTYVYYLNAAGDEVLKVAK